MALGQHSTAHSQKCRSLIGESGFMGMEHRWHTRVIVDVGVIVYRHGLPVATGRVRDASRGGMFVESDYSELQKCQALELEICLGERVESTRYRLRAWVSRRVRDGVGIELDEDDLDARHVMERVIRGAAPQYPPNI